MSFSGQEKVDFGHGFSHKKSSRWSPRSKVLRQSDAPSDWTQGNSRSRKKVAVVRKLQGFWCSGFAGVGEQGGADGVMQVHSGA